MLSIREKASCRKGAIRIRDKIMRYWRDRGYAAEVRIMRGLPVKYDEEGNIIPDNQDVRYDLRSNIYNGWPPKITGRKHP